MIPEFNQISVNLYISYIYIIHIFRFRFIFVLWCKVSEIERTSCSKWDETHSLHYYRYNCNSDTKFSTKTPKLQNQSAECAHYSLFWDFFEVSKGLASFRGFLLKWIKCLNWIIIIDMDKKNLFKVRKITLEQCYKLYHMCHLQKIRTCSKSLK